MAYEKQTWVDRETEHPTRRRLTAVPGQNGVYEITREQGDIYAEGTPINADRLNHMEDGIDAKQDALSAQNKLPYAYIADTPTTLPNPYPLTFGEKTYDGSAAQTLTAADIGLGTVFNLLGSKATVSDLPASGNTIGDVWYVIAEHVGYVWLNDGTARWEQLGLPIDLSNYAEVDGTYPDMSVGHASEADEADYADKAGEADNIGAVRSATVSTPFLFRPSGGGADVDGDLDAKADISAIYGKTVVWNQQVPDTEPDAIDVADWGAVAADIRAGKHPFLIGQELIAHKDDHNIIFRVMDYDHHKKAGDPTAHTMTLEMKYLYGTASAYKSIQFDAVEALYYAENGLAAGAYYFTVKNQAWYTADNDIPYYFTLNNPIPAGGQLVLDMTYNRSLEGKSIESYASRSSTTVIETATLSATQIYGAVNLGEPDGNTENMNHMHRAIFGSNNYAQSAIRQWLNSDDAVGTFWQPRTKFDRPPTWHTESDTGYDGFAKDFSEDFISAVAAASIPCRTNSIYEGNSLDGTEFSVNQTYNIEDKFFLLSRPEIYGDWDSTSYKDGKLLDYYDGMTQQEKIKNDEFGSARNAWLRSPNPSYGSGERNVRSDGSLYGYYVYTAYGVAVACIIA